MHPTLAAGKDQNWPLLTESELMQLLAGKDQVIPHESPSPKSTSYNAQVNRQVCYSENYMEQIYLKHVFQISSVIVVWCDDIHGMHLPCINPKKVAMRKILSVMGTGCLILMDCTKISFLYNCQWALGRLEDEKYSKVL